MKKLFTLFFSILFFALVQDSFAQNSAPNWQPVWLSIDGTNSFHEVDAYYALTSCGGVETVLIKLVNHNNFSLKAEWKDMVLTLDDKQVFRSKEKNSILLKANSESAGDCSGNNIQLVVKYSDFAIDKKNFKTFITSEFDFSVIH